MKVTTLDALLLFLVSHKAQSGYDIRQLIQSTPLGIFSDSPGAIYPALARLEARGLLTSEAEAGGRRKRAYLRTEAGDRELRVWLRKPVDLDTVTRRPQELDLRHTLLAQVLGRAAAMDFAHACAKLETQYLAEVEAFQAGPGQAMDRASQESVDLGLRLIRTRLQWRREVLSTGRDDAEDERALVDR
ncbi:MAG TPA: PadR family transcriptional regulator [Caulobacteraceae bacterium]|jgi:DNA-binding PadR family transcriptional regulator